MKTYNLIIEVLSPVHIGDARGRLSALEFFQDRQAVYLVNEKAWAKKLAAMQGIDDFVRYVERESFPSLEKFLEGLGASRANPLRQGTFLRRIAKGEPLWLSNFQPFISDSASRQPYIPGSSLKGAIRSALLFYLAGKSRDKAAIISRALQRRLKQPGEGFDNLLRASLPEKKGTRRSPNSDWLRALQITDAYPLNNDCTEVREARVISLNEGRGYHFGAREARLFVEVVKPGTRFKARLKLDQHTWDILHEASGEKPSFVLEKWLELGRDKSRQVLDKEKELFRQAGLTGIVEELDQIAARGANLRLGWGTGLLNTSLALHLSPEERRALRETYFSRRRHPEFPQSRKVVTKGGQPAATLGWLKLTLS
ncbi:type III-A CRISPR-associated RAMP protein Csm5 [Moorella sp. E306M]|uniref:type III-A CRISPR-associated RAMP protein Csm5 n=1 Tax=Moorella sp. E306M TaxID=2572683 RepID=UPI0010FFB3EF|nr:type III-A CRISPR-associated RAMP protein Csm5 [Moorella sp. E306M]GEA18925.1 type III-A CRISPR-associated RAMP protein Csm5 [Moorella sp. E306M]